MVLYLCHFLLCTNVFFQFYRTQCGMYGWGAYSQPCSVTSPSTPNPTAMCAGKCVCGPVCITTVPTIHRLLGLHMSTPLIDF